MQGTMKDSSNCSSSTQIKQLRRLVAAYFNDSLTLRGHLSQPSPQTHLTNYPPLGVPGHPGATAPPLSFNGTTPVNYLSKPKPIFGIT